MYVIAFKQLNSISPSIVIELINALVIVPVDHKGLPYHYDSPNLRRPLVPKNVPKDDVDT